MDFTAYSHAMSRHGTTSQAGGGDHSASSDVRRVSFQENTERSTDESLSSYVVEEAALSPVLQKRLVTIRRESRSRNELDMSSHDRLAIGNHLDVVHHNRQDVRTIRQPSSRSRSALTTIAPSGVTSETISPSSMRETVTSSMMPMHEEDNNCKPDFLPIL